MATGQHEALATLYDRHRLAVYALALRILSDQADAEEVVQVVFTQAWRSASTYDGSRCPVLGWLFMMTRSRALDRLRRRRPDERGPDGEPALALMSAVMPASEDRLFALRQATRIRTALAVLPIVQKVAVELAFFEELSHNEIAERLEQPLGTVKTRIRTALFRLREAMESTA